MINNLEMRYIKIYSFNKEISFYTLYLSLKKEKKGYATNTIF